MNAKVSRHRSQLRKTNNTARTLRWTPAVGEGLPLLTIKVGEVETKYVVAEIGSDIGRGFFLAKLGHPTGEGETYETHVGGEGCSCTCPGFLWGWACRHCAAMAKVVELGLVGGAK